MRTLRTAVIWATLVLLTLGYGASQYAYFAGDPSEYAHQVDTPPVSHVALLLFLAIVILAFIPDKTKTDKQDSGSDEDTP